MSATPSTRMGGPETESAKYARAMVAGADRTCAAIERVHGLYGYPPELVSVGLRAFDEGRDAATAVADYLEGGAA